MSICYLRGKFAIIHKQRAEIRYRHRMRGWTTIESYGNGTEVDDPISKGQKNHPRCVVTMCRRGERNKIVQKTKSPWITGMVISRDSLRKKYNLKAEIREREST